MTSCRDVIEGATRSEDEVGRRNKQEWTDCVQSDIRGLGIAGDWKETALGAEAGVG